MKRNLRLVLPGLAVMLALVCCVNTATAQPTRAQEWKYRGEVFGGAGWGGLYHGDNHQFSNLSLGGGVQARPFDGAWSGLGFEGRFDYLRSGSDLYKDVQMISGNVLYQFGRSRTQPFVYGGVCFLRGERTVVVTYASEEGVSHQESYQDSLNKIGLNLGAGLRIALNGNLSIRPELRLTDTTPGEGYNLGIPQFLVSMGYSR